MKRWVHIKKYATLARAVFAFSFLITTATAWSQEAYLETPEGTLVFKEAGRESLFDVFFKPNKGKEKIIFGASLELTSFFYSSEASDPALTKRGTRIPKNVEYGAYITKHPLNPDNLSITVIHLAGTDPVRSSFVVSKNADYKINYTPQNILYTAIKGEDRFTVFVYHKGHVTRVTLPSHHTLKDLKINYDGPSSTLIINSRDKFIKANLRTQATEASPDLKSQVSLEELRDPTARTALAEPKQAVKRTATMVPLAQLAARAADYLDFADRVSIGNSSESIFDHNATFEREAHEFDQLAAALSDPQNPRAVITGEDGSGKTEFVNSFIAQAKKGLVAGITTDTLFWHVNSAEFENSDAGSTSQFLNQITSAITATDYPVVLVIDKIDQLAYKGTHRDNPVGALQGLNSFLGNKKIKIIGISNPDDYDTTIGSDPALKQNFPAIKFKSPTPEETFSRIWKRIEKENLGVSEEQLALIIHYAEQFDPSSSIMSRGSRLMNKVLALAKRKNIAIEDLSENMLKEFIANIYSIDHSYVFTDLAEEAHKKFAAHVEEDFFLEPQLKKHLIELDAAYRSENYRRNQKVPVGRILLTGAPGKGKTHIAQSTAEFMGLPYHRLSLADYLTHDGVEKLREAIGKIITEQPLSLIFIDELEKAYDKEGHPNELQTTLLSILDSKELKYTRRLSQGSEQRRTLRVHTNHTYFMFGGNVNPSVIHSMKKRGRNFGFNQSETVAATATKLTSGDLVNSGYNPNLVSRLIPYFYDGPQTKEEHVRLINHVIDQMLNDYGMNALDEADAADLTARKSEILNLAYDSKSNEPQMTPRDIVNYIKQHFEISWVVSREKKYNASASSCLARLKKKT